MAPRATLTQSAARTSVVSLAVRKTAPRRCDNFIVVEGKKGV
jgi:hypothetical protein